VGATRPLELPEDVLDSAALDAPPWFDPAAGAPAKLE
jgi:hypothetical protein